MFALSPFAFPSISVPTGEGDMELIFKTTLTSDTATISTGTLSAGFSSLLINLRARSDMGFAHGSRVGVYFNGDLVSSNYQRIESLCRDDSSTVTRFNDNSALTVHVPTAAGDANFFGAASVRIYNHELSTGFKSGLIQYGIHSFAAIGSLGFERFLVNTSFIWRNTAPITSVVLKSIPHSWDAQNRIADLVTGSSVGVYGLK